MSAALTAFLNAEPAVALVRVVAAQGSTPREQGAWMLVSPRRILGTIGGGQLEYKAIDEARLGLGTVYAGAHGRIGERSLDIPLGPEIGQCCGGRVGLTVTVMSELDRENLADAVRTEEAKLPTVMLFGGGHVGLALASAFALLPLKIVVVETRAEALEAMPQGVETHLTPVPEEAVRVAAPGSALLVLTHDHALDFLIVAEALARPDTAYIGMIGSKTKKATFRSWYLRHNNGLAGTSPGLSAQSAATGSRTSVPQ